MGFKRDLFTGELVETQESEHGRQIIYSEEIPPSMRQDKICNPYSKPWVSQSLAVHPSQVAEFNEAAKRNGTGAFYRKDGALVCESRGARAREMRARGKFDQQGGFGDYTG